MKSAASRTIVMPDLHAPYHDQRAFDCFLAAAYASQADELVIIGDAADFYAVSFHDKSPARKHSLADEVEQTNRECFDRLESMGFPSVHYCSGNHENRYNRYLAKVAPELYGLAPTIQEMLRIEERGWHWHEYGTPYKHGKMSYVHDVGLCGKAASQRSLEAYGQSLTIGHTHRLTAYYAGTGNGDHHVCLNVGHLLDLSAVDYMHRWKTDKDWQHGFGLVDYYDDGSFHAQPVPIVNGRCVVDGYVVSA